MGYIPTGTLRRRYINCDHDSFGSGNWRRSVKKPKHRLSTIISMMGAGPGPLDTAKINTYAMEGGGVWLCEQKH